MFFPCSLRATVAPGWLESSMELSAASLQVGLLYEFRRQVRLRSSHVEAMYGVQYSREHVMACAGMCPGRTKPNRTQDESLGNVGCAKYRRPYWQKPAANGARAN